MSAKHHTFAGQVASLEPWLRVVLAMENAGWDAEHPEGYHQRLAWACARAMSELQRSAEGARG